MSRTSRIDGTRRAAIERELGERLDNRWSTPPIPFRRQNAGDYEIPPLTLRDEVNPQATGFAAHLA